MANMQKYKLGQLGRILDENARDENYHADRIDSELTKNNYFLSKHCDYSLANSGLPMPSQTMRGLPDGRLDRMRTSFSLGW